MKNIDFEDLQINESIYRKRKIKIG